MKKSEMIAKIEGAILVASVCLSKFKEATVEDHEATKSALLSSLSKLGELAKKPLTEFEIECLKEADKILNNEK